MRLEVVADLEDEVEVVGEEEEAVEEVVIGEDEVVEGAVEGASNAALLVAMC